MAKQEEQEKIELIKQEHITEKAGENKQVFRVAKNANKPEIKKELEKKYKINIIKINIINRPVKPRRLRGIKGLKPGYKKAIITLKHGQKINTAKKEKSRKK